MNRHVAKRRVPRTMARLLIAGALLAATVPVAAQSLLIRGATVHTAGAQGSLQNTDVLVQGGRIAAIGTGLAAGDAPVIEANGRPLTPTLFGGVTGSAGASDVSGSKSAENVPADQSNKGSGAAVWIILALAVIPNPLFDLAGVAAGVLRIPLWKFLLVCAIGKIVKMLIFSYSGFSILRIFTP